MEVDKKVIKPVPLQKTLILVNNFLVHTADLFNSFSSTVEDKISNISSKITELEILLSVLDVELKSTPLDSMAESAEETTLPMGGSSVAVPAPHDESPLSTTPAAEPNSPHPDYLPFSKLLSSWRAYQCSESEDDCRRS